MSAFFALTALLSSPALSVTLDKACSLNVNARVDETATVIRVFDGDTVLLSDGRKLRIIGINTPETKSKYHAAEPYGKKARDFLRKLLIKSSSIQIRIGAQKKDRYGRLLAHIFLKDKRNVSAMMLQFGLARSLHVPPNNWKFRCYDRLDKRAQRLKIGLWSEKFFETVDVTTLQPSKAYKSKFLQVTGTVTRIGDSTKNIWVNLGSQFALRINKFSLPAFNEIQFKKLIGKKIEARGYVVYYPKRKQFRMLVRHPIALTIVD